MSLRLPRLLLAPSLVVLLGALPAPKDSPLHAEIDRRAEAVVPKAVAWRRDFHQNPELGNREARTGKIVAEHLRGLGFEVKTGVAHTGVVGVLKGGRPGPVVALRSDMDALPVTEEVDLPFASKARAEWAGRDTGVMHACGHDMHMAILMGTAEVLAGMKASLPGTVKVIFQPSEEGPPAGEEGGAEMMVKEGVLSDPKVDVIFGLHVFPYALGTIVYKPEGIMAASDTVTIKVHGRQTHGALPWAGIDPIVVSSQIVLGLQTIVSRQSDLTTAPAIVTIGLIQGGNRENIVPEDVTLKGTIRTFDPGMRQAIHERVKRTAERIAESAGATADVTIDGKNPVTFNDPKLTEWAGPSLRRVAPEGRYNPNGRVTTTAEDFARYQEKVPGVFFFLGITPDGRDPATAAPNHSPRFYADEGAIVTGVRALSSLAIDYLAAKR
ncbi:MAG TPA: amidohydrolase [Vicinamibacteria bacterium]|nr:amidohydrolase [Vicinamibacteria bacterium]